MRRHDPANGNGGGTTTIDDRPAASKEATTLTLDEFLHRWEQHPEIKYAELIGGIVYMPSPTTFLHGETEGDLGTILGNYAANTAGVRHGTNSTTLMQSDSPQPDEYLRILPEYGGAVIPEGKYLRGPAEFIGEICVSSASYDLHQKLELVRTSGRARIPCRPDARTGNPLASPRQERLLTLLEPIHQDDLEIARLSRPLARRQSTARRGDSAKLLATLKQGMRSPEHAAFVKRLAKKKKK